MGISATLMRLIKSPIFMILSFIILILFLLLFKSSHPVITMLPHQSISGGGKLREVLRAASMPSRTVILTIVDKTWASHGSIVDLFLESFQIGEGTKTLLNHLIIVGLDMQSVHYCESIHPHCFHLEATGIMYDAQESFTSLNYPTLAQKRNQLLLQILQFGYSVLYTDADVMWLKNPFPVFESGGQVIIGCDSYSKKEGKVTSGGFFYIQADEIPMEFIDLWDMIKVLYPYAQNQSLCEIAPYEDFKMIYVKIRFVDTKYFGGFCEPSRDISNIYMMHANCCDNLENKVHDLKIFLDDSKYKGLMGRGSTLEMLSSSGRSPMRCLSS